MNEHYQKLEEAKSKMFAGVGFAIMGVILTAVSSVFFDNRVVIFWGLVVFGGIQFIVGVFDFLANGGLGSIKQPSFAENNLKCNHCKKENDKNSKFCIHCGTSVDKNTNDGNVKYTLSSSAITLIAYVSKADGIITQNEAKIVSEVLDYISGNDVNFREHIKNIFIKAKDDNIENYKQVAPIFYEIVKNQINENERESFLNEFVRWLVFLVFADGSLNQKQSYITDDIAKILHISPYYIKSLYDEFGKQNQDKENKTYKKGAKTLNECYEILKCHQNSNNDEIRNSYRMLVRQYHPDIIQGKGLSEDFLLFANQKLQDLNMAYETIKNHRGI